MHNLEEQRLYIVTKVRNNRTEFTRLFTDKTLAEDKYYELGKDIEKEKRGKLVKRMCQGYGRSLHVKDWMEYAYNENASDICALQITELYSLKENYNGY